MGEQAVEADRDAHRGQRVHRREDRQVARAEEVVPQQRRRERPRRAAAPPPRRCSRCAPGGSLLDRDDTDPVRPRSRFQGHGDRGSRLTSLVGQRNERRRCTVEELRGRTALVTGASGGLGAHLARRLAREGMNVALAARREPELAALAQELEALGVRAAALPADLSDLSQIDPLIERAEAALGPIDLLVNNAGVEIGGCLSPSSPARNSPRRSISTSPRRCCSPTACCRGCSSAGAATWCSSPRSAGKLGPRLQRALRRHQGRAGRAHAVAARRVPARAGRLLGGLPRLHRRRRHVPADGRRRHQVQPPDGRDHRREGHRRRPCGRSSATYPR